MDRFISKEIKMNLAADYLNKYFQQVYLRCGNVLLIKLTFNGDD